MTVIIPQWLFDHMVAKFGLEEAEKTVQLLGIRVVEDWSDVNEDNQNPQGGSNGLG